jgi:hypothetical protein
VSDKKLFKDTVWHGKAMYQCNVCPWSTLDCAEMEKHAAKHLEERREKVRRVDTGLVGPSGGKIVREEVIKPENPAEEDSDG